MADSSAFSYCSRRHCRYGRPYNLLCPPLVLLRTDMCRSGSVPCLPSPCPNSSRGPTGLAPRMETAGTRPHTLSHGVGVPEQTRCRFPSPARQGDLQILPCLAVLAAALLLVCFTTRERCGTGSPPEPGASRLRHFHTNTRNPHKIQKFKKLQ